MISERSLFLHLLRILSAFIVVLGHTKEFLFVHMNENANLPEKIIRLFLSLGSAAVLVFFFLSGYLVGGKVIRKSLDGDLSFRLYIFDRLTRLWIVLLPALFVTFAINALTCMNSRISLYCSADTRLASHASVPPVFSQDISDFFANLFFLQPFHGMPWGGNGPLWSLSYEFWYYLVFFSLVVILDNFLKRDLNYGLIFHFFIIFLASRILEFEWVILGFIWIGGALASYLLEISPVKFVSSINYKFRKLKFTTVTIVLIIPVLIILKSAPRLIALPMSVLLLMFSVFIMKGDDPSNINRKLQALIIRGSEFSFSLYLIHFPVLALAATYLTPINRWEMSGLGLLIMLGIDFVVLIAAYAFAWMTEFNLVRFRLRLLSVRK